MNDLPFHVVPRLGDRALFPDLRAHAYLAYAAISPAAVPVRDAVRALLDDYARLGLGAFERWHHDRSALREALATWIGAAHPEDLAWMPNTSAGVIAIAQSLRWTAGERVVVFDGDFPANVTPWQQAAGRYDLQVLQVSFDDLACPTGPDWEPLERVLSQGVRLVAISAVQFQTGLRVPLAELARRCHNHGALLFVDGIQACGAVPLDVRAMGVDFLACGSHKWLMGLEGGGFLYIAPEHLDALDPHLAGWLSHEGALDFLFQGPGHLRYDRPIRQQANLFEAGTAAAVSLAALHGSVRMLRGFDPAQIHTHVNTYLDALEPALGARGFRSLRCPDPARRSCILSVVPPADLDATAIVKALAEADIVCSAPDGLLRFAPHWPNALSEVPEVIAAIDAVCGKLRASA